MPARPETHVSGTRALSREPQVVPPFETDTITKPPSTVESFCLWESLAHKLQLPWLSYASIDQGSQELCVAASFAQAVFAGALLKYPQLRTTIYNILCPWVLYHRVCQAECKRTGRCKCASKQECQGICDPECGTTIVTMIEMMPTRPWVSANLSFAYSIRAVREIEVGPGAIHAIAECLARHVPIIINLYLYQNQSRFFDSHDLLVSGYGASVASGAHKSKQEDSDMALVTLRPKRLIDGDTFTNPLRHLRDGIASAHVQFPTRQGRKQDRGHCIIITGMFSNNGELMLRCRNTFGRRWGHNGDFSMRAADIDAEQVHKLVWIDPDDIGLEVFRPFE